MNWISGIGVFLAIAIAGLVLLPLVGLLESGVEVAVFLLAVVILVFALSEIPGVLGRGHRKKGVSYGLNKIKKS